MRLLVSAGWLLSQCFGADPCERLCQIDPNPRCREIGSWSVAGVFCYGYYYKTEDRSGDFCFHSLRELDDCPVTANTVMVDDARQLFESLRRSLPGVVEEPSESTGAPEERTHRRPVSLVWGFVKRAMSDDLSFLARTVFANRAFHRLVRELVAHSQRSRSPDLYSAPTRVWMRLGGNRLAPLVRDLDPLSTHRERTIMKIYLVLSTGIPSQRPAQFLQATGLLRYCEDSAVSIERLVKLDFVPWKDRMFSGHEPLYLSLLYAPFSPLASLCPAVFSDPVAKTHLFIDHLFRAAVSTGAPAGIVRVQVNRSSVLADSVQQLLHAGFLTSKFEATFANESGYGSGVTREWFSTVAESLLESLFDTNGTANIFKPRVIDDAEMMTFGIILALSLREKIPIPIKLPLRYYAEVLAKPVGIDDIAADEPELSSSFRDILRWTLDGDPELEFDLEVDKKVHQFTDGNKRDLITRYLNPSLKDYEMQALQLVREGFTTVIPSYVTESSDLLTPLLLREATFSAPLPGADELRAHVRFHGGFEQTSNQIQWLFEVLENDAKRASWIRFVTGLSGTPLGGLPQLSQPIVISKVTDASRLPTARTCFHQFFLPEYPTREALVRSLDVIFTSISTMED